jgi:hypothetical protein
VQNVADLYWGGAIVSAKLQTMKMAALVVSTTLAGSALVPARAQTSDNVIDLNQAWSQNDREWYWHISQGSTEARGETRRAPEGRIPQVVESVRGR